MNALVLASLLAQPVPGPELNLGTNQWFQQSAVAVMRDLEAGRFAAAKSGAARLPDASVTLGWDEAGLSASQKASFAEARDRALAAWKEAYPALTFKTVAKSPEIKFSFAPTLPPNADTIGPAAAVFLTSQDPSDPTVDAVIALRRGRANAPAQAMDIHNEVVFAIGTHLGMARVPIPGSAMFRTEEIYRQWQRPVSNLGGIIRQNFELGAMLRKYAAEQKRIVPALPQIGTDPIRYDNPNAVQGDQLTFTIQVVNRGKAPLRYNFVPDCSCFFIRQGTSVPPGESYTIPITVDTTFFPGKQSKNLYLYSNDPDSPVRVFPVTFEAKPRYRFLWDEMTDVLQVDDAGRVAVVYLIVEESKPLQVKSMQVAGGVSGVVSFEPWEGERADPAMGEPSRKRKGYRAEILFSSSVGEGRRPVSLEVETTDEVFTRINFPFFLQRGIVALPSQLYLGELQAKRPSTGTVIISRPGKTFKVTRVTSNSPHITGRAEAIPDRQDLRVVVNYDGKAETGDFEATLTVHTDDPKQPTVPVRVTARLR